MNANTLLTAALAQYSHFRRIAEDDLPFLMQWRNSQQSVLRQETPLSPDDQARWWTNSVTPSYRADRPQMVLLALDRGQGITSYGGLTNINWSSQRAEVSFLADTLLLEDDARYSGELQKSLAFYTDLAFNLFCLQRLHTETWCFRHRHIEVLEEFGFRLEGRLRQHVIKNGRAVDALLHGLLADDRILK